jgi:hypothetical protein
MQRDRLDIEKVPPSRKEQRIGINLDVGKVKKLNKQK